MTRKRKKFQLKSGPKMTMSSFKMMGSSPVLQNGDGESTDDDLMGVVRLPEVKIEADRPTYTYEEVHDEDYGRSDITGWKFQNKIDDATGESKRVETQYDSGKAKILADLIAEHGGKKGEQMARQLNFQHRLTTDESGARIGPGHRFYEINIQQFEKQFPDLDFDTHVSYPES